MKVWFRRIIEYTKLRERAIYTGLALVSHLPSHPTRRFIFIHRCNWANNRNRNYLVDKIDPFHPNISRICEAYCTTAIGYEPINTCSAHIYIYLSYSNIVGGKCLAGLWPVCNSNEQLPVMYNSIAAVPPTTRLA